MKRNKGKAWIISLVLAVAVALTSCAVQAPGEVGLYQKLAEDCPDDMTRASYVGIDVSGSGLTEDITAARQRAVRDIATRTAVCGGHLHVDAFTGSSVASRVVYDQAFNLEGATEIAQLRKVSERVEAAMQAIDKNLAEATQELSKESGSDITAQFRLITEYGHQMNEQGKVQLTADLMTDGEQNVGISLQRGLTTSAASDLAKQVPVVSLPPDTEVKISGLGKTAEPVPPSSHVEALKSFYETYCARTGAQCSVVTDYTTGS